MMSEKKIEELSTAEKVSKFLIEKKKAIVTISIIVVVALLALIVSSFAISSTRDKALVRVDALETKVIAITEKNSDFEQIISDLEKEVKGKSYSSVKAQYLEGAAYFAVGEYSKAAECYEKAYELNKEIYLAPLALVNAAVSSENSGDSNKAIDFYTLAVDYEESGVKGRALFNIGRINLEKGEKELAKTYFELLVNEVPFSEFAAIAKNILTTF